MGFNGKKGSEKEPFCLILMWYRASIAEIPLLWGGGGGYRTSTSHAL